MHGTAPFREDWKALARGMNTATIPWRSYLTPHRNMASRDPYSALGKCPVQRCFVVLPQARLKNRLEQQDISSKARVEPYFILIAGTDGAPCLK